MRLVVVGGELRLVEVGGGGGWGVQIRVPSTFILYVLLSILN